MSYNPVEAGKPEPLFWSEMLPVTKEDVARALRLVDYSREDLLTLISDLSDRCLDLVPPGESRTIKKLLGTHSLRRTLYITRLDVDLPSRHPKDVLEMLNHTRNVAVDFLKTSAR